MKNLLPLLLVAGTWLSAPASPDPLAIAWPESPPAHPRLYFTDAALARMVGQADDPVTGPITRHLLDKAERLLEEPPLERRQIGRRLLSVSRQALQRLMYWSWAWRVSGDDRYLQRATQEMDALSAFRDWNPSHFLDVAEMTHAMAVGYDTFYPALDTDRRARYRDAILQLGLEPSFAGHHWWIDSHINWNQVCHGGLVAGALAVMEDAPDRARQVVRRAVKNAPLAMDSYAPDGAYPEGPGYWVYGTTYSVVLLDLLDQVLGTTFGLADRPGFMDSATYMLHLTGPTGSWFSYPDCGERHGPVVAPFWFARKADDASLMYNELRWLQREPLRSNIAPLVLRWMPDEPSVLPPQALSWMGRGENPVAAHRSAWGDPAAWFLAIKGGSPSVSHGHMDLGAFVLQGDGVDWVVETGSESYHAIEQRGMSLWPRENGADRWTIYRYHNRGHNTLVVNDAEQVAEAFAPIAAHTPWPDALTSVDLTPAYAPALKQALRTARLSDGGATIVDQLQAGDAPASVEWIFHTPARVTVLEQGRLRLEKNGRTLWVQGPSPEAWSIRSLAEMPNEWDTPDPELTRCAFRMTVPARESVTWTVRFAERL